METRSGTSEAAARRREALRLKADVSAALLRFALTFPLEGKTGFRPDQARVPRGSGRESGRWSGGGGGGGGGLAALSPEKVWADAQAATRHASDAVQSFVERNQTSITRFLGGVQAAGGGIEAFAGGALVAGGVVTSETGVGIGVAVLGGWMVTNGYDNFDAGLRSLATGTPHDTSLNRLLQGLGLSESEADAAEVGLGLSMDAGAAKMGARALDAVAKRGLALEAIKPFADDVLHIDVGGYSLWESKNIVARGAAWEAYDAAETGFARTASNFPVFDQVSKDGRIGVSNKTLNLFTDGYSRTDRAPVLARVGRYVDQVANFTAIPKLSQALSYRPAAAFAASGWESFAGTGCATRRRRGLCGQAWRQA